MSHLLLLLLLSSPTEQPLSRVIFDVEITQGQRSISAKLVLSQLTEDRLSIHCRKNTAGTIFTYWATELSDTLYLPREQVAYRGEAGSEFRLFPDGPALDRKAWLKLLLQRSSSEIGNYSIRIDQEWRVLEANDQDWTIRWKERSRSKKTRYSARVLTPTLKQGTDIRSIAEVGRDLEATPPLSEP